MRVKKTKEQHLERGRLYAKIRREKEKGIESTFRKPVSRELVSEYKPVVRETKSISTTNPELIPWFKNLADADRVSIKATGKVEIVCPICRAESVIKIISLTTNKEICPKCRKDKNRKTEIPRNNS